MDENKGSKMHEGPIIDPIAGPPGDPIHTDPPGGPISPGGPVTPPHTDPINPISPAPHPLPVDPPVGPNQPVAAGVDDEDEGSDEKVKSFEDAEDNEKNPAMMEPSTATHNNPEIPDPPPTDPLIPAHPGVGEENPVRAGFGTSTPAA